MTAATVDRTPVIAELLGLFEPLELDRKAAVIFGR